MGRGKWEYGRRNQRGKKGSNRTESKRVKRKRVRGREETGYSSSGRQRGDCCVGPKSKYKKRSSRPWGERKENCKGGGGGGRGQGKKECEP